VASAHEPTRWGNLQLEPVTQVMEVQDLLLILGYEWK
jgi:hypothetical protein